MRPRLFLVLLVVMSLSFVLRTGNIVSVLIFNDTENKPLIGATQAIAQDAEEEVENILDSVPGAQENVEEGLVNSEAERRASVEDLLAPRFTDEEIEVLQNLGERREQLDEMEARLLQKERLLEVTQKKIEEKLSELTTLKAELQDLIGEQQGIQEDRLKQLVKIYETMKPKDAARIFNDLQFDILMAIVERMSERRTAPILANMEPEKARYLSAKLAEQRALPDPEKLVQ